ncbi:MAG TPA: DivIVA domain-containing protein [Gaiellaceae bacterium]|nr:DivIVA domain-containing protein [Gaiellaceae bacterium]
MGLRDSNKQAADGGSAREAGQEVPNPTTLGAEIARARRAAGMTQRELADKLDVRLWMVDEWEAGAKPIASDQLEHIAAAVGTSSARLLGREDAVAPATKAPPADSAQPTQAQESQPSPQAAPAQQQAPQQQAPQQPQLAQQQLQPQPHVPTPIRPQLTAEQIRSAEIPRGFRGYEESATRRLLAEIAANYERAISERDGLRLQIERLESSLAGRQDYDTVVSERAALQQRIEELEQASAAANANSESLALLSGERDDLRRQVEEMTGQVEELNTQVNELSELLSAQDGDEALVAERDELRKRVEELESTLASREESEQMLTRALLAAGRAGEELVKQAQAEAEAIVTGARREAEQVEKELEERRKSIDKERDSVRRQLRREALASARADLEGLHREAEPVLEGLLALSDRLRALIWPDSVESVPSSELLEDLRPQGETEPVADDTSD